MEEKISYWFVFESKEGILVRYAVWVSKQDWKLALEKAKEMAMALDATLRLDYHY